MRELALALLDDDSGINEKAWFLLRKALNDEGNNADIISAVKCQDGRYYLPT